MFQKPLFWVVAWAAPCNLRAQGAAVRRVPKGMICSGCQKLLLWLWLFPGHLIALGSWRGSSRWQAWQHWVLSSGAVTVFPWLRQSYFGKSCFSKTETHHSYSIAGTSAVWGIRSDESEGKQHSEDVFCSENFYHPVSQKVDDVGKIH